MGRRLAIAAFWVEDPDTEAEQQGVSAAVVEALSAVEHPEHFPAALAFYEEALLRQVGFRGMMRSLGLDRALPAVLHLPNRQQRRHPDTPPV